MEFNSEYIEAIEGFQKIKEGLAEVVASKARVAVTSLSSAFSAQIQNVLKETWNLTKFMNPLAEALKALYNPESLFSYEKYKNALNGYHWTLPYDMKAENLNELLSTVDSEVAFDKYMIKYFSKDKTDAKRMLTSLSNNYHFVVSGVTIYNKEEIHQINSISKVFFKDLSEKDIDEYLENDEYKDKAGSYAIQGIASKFIDHIEGDYDTIVGFTTSQVKEVLDKILN
ncbi:MAG: Maf family protein [Firmicutes bacterium]|nr:Maf family protein [Bacillota bacterium]